VELKHTGLKFVSREQRVQGHYVGVQETQKNLSSVELMGAEGDEFGPNLS
jgi:hypothetical protein